MRLTMMLLVGFGFAGSIEAGEPDPSVLTLDRIITADEFRPDGFGPARWTKDSSGYTTLESSTGGHGRDLVRYEAASGRREVLVDAANLRPEGANEPITIEDYAWSENGQSLLIFTNSRRVWRRNTRGDYYVYDLEQRSLRRIGKDAPTSSLMFAKFSPDGRRVAYVRENNIYVQDLDKGDGSIALTDDGSPTRINGTFDWVYEEEFDLRDGFRWSPDGKSIAYWQIDTSGMSDYVLVNTTEELYPKVNRFAYPKVGQKNPYCRLGIVPSRGGDYRFTSYPGQLQEGDDDYIARMEWADDSGGLIVQRINRSQNRIRLKLELTNSQGTYLEEKDEAWVDVVEGVRWVADKFTWISERDGWRHLYLSDSNGNLQVVTAGEYDVIEVLRLDDEAKEVDFIASPDDPKARYLFRVPLDGSTPARRLTPENQTGTHSNQISPDGKWAIHTYSTFRRPPVIDLVSLPDHKVVRTLVDNAKLAAKVEALKPVATEFFRVAVEDGTELDGYCLKPPGFDPSKRYPLLMHVYGEPAGQTVLDRWGGRNDLWHRMLAQRGFVVASVDNRGTPGPRGRAWRKSVYKQIGILASKDQAEAVRALEKRWPFVDPNRVGVWGWSGGGSMSLNAIFRHPDLYQTAVAVAFVSDQKLYDSIYQERYMGLPADNPAGYRDGSPINFAENLKGNLLLAYGTGDDNCHYQNCERLIDRLVAANKPFSMLAYPNRTHSISEGKNTSRHLYESMTRYLEQNLRP